MVEFELKHPQATHEMLGYIPHFLSAADSRSAEEQFKANYPYGRFGPLLKGMQITDRGLEYPGDPPMVLVAEFKLREEIIRVYNCAWVTITQADGTFKLCKMD